jgi:hypothetical protein
VKLPNSAVKRVKSRVEQADLGDERRSARLSRVVEKLARAPSASFPEAMGTGADLEAGYRFVNNSAVSMGALNNAHAEHVAQLARDLGRAVLAIHDTTCCQFPRVPAEEIGYLSTGKPGFQLHMSLVADTEGDRRPLGITHVEPIIRLNPPSSSKHKTKKKRKLSGAETARKKDRESSKWWSGIEETERHLDGVDVIHVADRESDGYELLARCMMADYRFVFRVRVAERRTRTDDDEWVPLQEAVEKWPIMGTRDVILSAREQRDAPRANKGRPPRDARDAILDMSATGVEIRRPKYAAKDLPQTLEIGVVCVRERNPPQGEAPVQWLLFTSEPVRTKRDVERIVDYYRARWLIEELNKALKTGCAYETRHFESRDALLTVLALLLPIACEVLWLRSRSRDAPDAPATDVLTPLQLKLLPMMEARPLPARPTARDALLALASIGGHHRSNGDPGWQVLMRSRLKLEAFEAGWLARDLRGQRA